MDRADIHHRSHGTRIIRAGPSYPGGPAASRAGAADGQPAGRPGNRASPFESGTRADDIAAFQLVRFYPGNAARQPSAVGDATADDGWRSHAWNAASRAATGYGAGPARGPHPPTRPSHAAACTRLRGMPARLR